MAGLKFEIGLKARLGRLQGLGRPSSAGRTALLLETLLKVPPHIVACLRTFKAAARAAKEAAKPVLLNLLMSGLLPAGSGSLTDLWSPSHVCSLQPCLRRHSSLDVRSHGRKGIDSSDSGLTRRCSQHGQNLLPCLKQQQQRLSSKRCRRPICRAASQPLPSGVHRPCLAAPRQGLRRSNSQSRLESPCRSTLAEPPVREETGGQVIHPEVVDPQKVDYDQEWSAYQRRFQSLKEVTDLTSGLMQAMEEIGSFSQTGFSVSLCARFMSSCMPWSILQQSCKLACHNHHCQLALSTCLAIDP